MKNRTLLRLPLLMAGLLWNAAAPAQEHDVLVAQAAPAEDTFAFAASEMGAERIVKGAPCPQKWKEHNPEAIERILPLITPLMREMGYDPND